MGRYTRGEFLGIGSALAGAFTFGGLPGASRTVAAQTTSPSTSGSVTAEPDLIVVNGNVLTSDTALPRAEAFAVKHGRFVAVGSNADIRYLATRRTQVMDYTPGPFEPLMALQSMVTRTDYKGRVWGATQKVSVDEALTIATINGAYASSEEHLKGSVTAGQLADFVVLEKDPHAVPPDEIMKIKVNRTVVGGTTVYG